MSTLKLDNLSGDEISTLLDIVEVGLKERKRPPFDDLLKKVHMSQLDFMRRSCGRKPKIVFLGYAEMDAFKTIPPWQLTSREHYTGSEQVMGLEVVRVIKDAFLQVA